MSEILILITTESSEKIAKNIALSLIENKLAVCVSLKNIYSIYKWEENIEETKEIEITIKSKPELKEDLIIFLKEISSYDVPQIIYQNFHTESKYNDWLTTNI